MPVKMKRALWSISATITIFLFLLLAGCNSSENAAVTVPEDAYAGQIVEMESCTYTANDVNYAAECGILVVPENRMSADSRLLALPITRVLATGSSPTEPIFALPGGPGITNYGTSRINWFIEKHDVVIVGYRGVDGSVQLDCPEVSAHIKNLPGDMLGLASMENMTNAYARCANRLQSEGIDMAGYTVVEVIDDLEDARLALGYEKINLYSVSYGTRLAMIYAWRHPESIYRSVMIAVNPPGHMFYYDPKIIDEQLADYSSLCAQDQKCSSQTDNLAETMRTVSQNMPDHWLGFPINRGMIRAASFESLSNTQDASMVFDTWLAASKGDYSGMVLLSLAGPMMFADATVWGENIAKAASADYEMTRDYRSDMNLPASILGSPRSEMASAAAGWPINTIPEEYQQVQPSDTETLLISGNIDLWTPLQFAEDDLLPYLSNGQHVVVAETGHAEMLSSQPEASKRLLTSFFDRGEVDDSLFTYQPWEYKVGLMSFPLLAKVMATAAIFLLLILIGIVRIIIRRTQRRKQNNINQIKY